LNIHYTTQFKKDYKRLKRQNKDLAKLQSLIRLLAKEQPLAPKYKDHSLTGKWKGHRDCHLAPDWLLIYQKTDNNLCLERTGSHSELFKK